MNTVCLELNTAHLCPTEAVNPPAAARVDLYAGIHKAMRAMMCDALLALGRMDPLDATEVAQVLPRVQGLLDFCLSHLHHENEFIHRALEARAPGSSTLIAEDHEAHQRDIAQLSAQLAAFQRAPQAARTQATLGLYRALALFVGHNFAHMQVEETAHNAALHAHYSDEELLALEQDLLSTIPPDEMMFTLRWMLPAMHHGERFQLMTDMQAKAPVEAVAATLDLVRPHLRTGEWDKLIAALRLAAPQQGSQGLASAIAQAEVF